MYNSSNFQSWSLNCITVTDVFQTKQHKHIDTVSDRVRVSFSAFLRSLGGFGPTRRSETSGSTAFMTMKQRPGCAPLPARVVSDRRARLYILICVPLQHCVTGFFFFYTCLMLDVVLWPPSPQDWLQSIQALMVLSVVFSSISFLVFLGQLITMSKGGLFYFTGLCQAFAGLEHSCISYLAAHTSLTFWRRVATIWFLETRKLALFGFTVDEMPCCTLKMDVVFAIQTFSCCTVLQKWLIVHLITIR